MKLCSLTSHIQIIALVIGLPVGAVAAHIPDSAATPGLDRPALQRVQERFVWDAAKKRKLRHAYWLLQQADRDYHGHKTRAVEELRKAGGIMGLDLKGEGYSGERQPWSDERLREARGLLEEIVNKTGEREFVHIRAAIHEIDRALETR